MDHAFKPLWPFRSGHQQTVLGYYLRKCQTRLHGHLYRVPLADGDTLHIYDTPPANWQPANPIALIVHGLGGSHDSGSVLQLARVCLKSGLRVIRINLRGSGESLPENRKPYHAGCSQDILEVLKFVTEKYSISPQVVMGLSLGGNIVLKLAAEVEQQQFPLLRKVVAISPPADLHRCSSLLGMPENAVYEKRFVQELCASAVSRAKIHHEPIPSFPKNLKLREFDDIYTAPRVGYGNVENYYAQASSAQLFHRIDIPTYILSAEDDPMIDAKPILEAKRSDAVTLHITKYGGHLGYISRLSQGTWCWLEQYVVKQINA
ncbi:MAG TPA: alpha/beta fold hydrolase [Gemmatales bacterium]|nr:alpha/beta fold hydrolase [Gemmatales bacterium]HMP16437.1 alpha/beta fold hydrolase [Gemmatales bacterium]